MDPVPGGNANAYVYALDPINFSDLSGMLSVVYNYGMQDGVGADVLQPTISTTRMQSIYVATIVIRGTSSAVKAKSPPAKARSATVVSPALAAPAVNANWFAQKAAQTRPQVMMASESFSYYDAAGAAMDWYAGGELIGGALGCAVGGILTAELGGIDCPEYAESWSATGGRIGASIGFILGGHGSSHAEDFGWGPDQTKPWFWEP